MPIPTTNSIDTGDRELMLTAKTSAPSVTEAVAHPEEAEKLSSEGL